MPASRTSSTRSSARSSPSVRPRPRTPSPEIIKIDRNGRRVRPGEYTRRDRLRDQLDRDIARDTRPYIDLTRDDSDGDEDEPFRLEEYARAIRRYDGNYAVRSTHSYIAQLEYRIRNLESNLSGALDRWTAAETLCENLASQLDDLIQLSAMQRRESELRDRLHRSSHERDVYREALFRRRLSEGLRLVTRWIDDNTVQLSAVV